MKKKPLDLKRRLSSATPEERKALTDGLPYEVGFAKPPEERQFRPGQSGNRRGRPKPGINLAEVLHKALSVKVDVEVGGRRRKLTKALAAMTQIANKMAGGNLDALRTGTEILRKYNLLPENRVPEGPPIEQRDLEAMTKLLSIFDQLEAAPAQDATTSLEAARGGCESS